ncbi:hypothetical protein B0A49_05497 [Cryomyces minteri]|uniref:Uncharacterized protein n=1 Tax=Cryomyces minteri TaxID=331657 RepID=A0A4V5NF08_9PEZI|nr:hypothetical protein B0A49_05497 [Cryomyces minteri]
MSSVISINPTQTILSDVSMVIIDIGKTASPWARETTYLLDTANGHTTSTIGRTVQPTFQSSPTNKNTPLLTLQLSGSLIVSVSTVDGSRVTSVIGTTSLTQGWSFVTVTPSAVSFEASSVSRSSVAGPSSSASSPNNATAPSSRMQVVIGIFGGVVALALFGAAVWFYRHYKQRRVKHTRLGPDSEGGSSSQNSLEKERVWQRTEMEDKDHQSSSRHDWTDAEARAINLQKSCKNSGGFSGLSETVKEFEKAKSSHGSMTEADAAIVEARGSVPVPMYDKVASANGPLLQNHSSEKERGPDNSGDDSLSPPDVQSSSFTTYGSDRVTRTMPSSSNPVITSTPRTSQFSQAPLSSPRPLKSILKAPPQIRSPVAAAPTPILTKLFGKDSLSAKTGGYVPRFAPSRTKSRQGVRFGGLHVKEFQEDYEGENRGVAS